MKSKVSASATADLAIPSERQNFKRLLASNPNYFGNLEVSTFKPVKIIAGNTTYEQLHCVGFQPERDLLEATIHLKRPSGYKGTLCQPGSTEYVRFYLDYGAGWEDVGLSSFNAHDIPNSKDCSGAPDKPLVYVVTLALDPKRKTCRTPVLPKVRAILSWETPPPALTPNWPPVWGNVLERNIQIKPRSPKIIDIYDDISATIGKPIKIPPYMESVIDFPIPLPDPEPFAPIATLAALYSTAANTKASAARGAEKLAAVEPHRFGLAHLKSALASGGLDQAAVTSASLVWKDLGLDWTESLKALDQTKADVSYEELRCVGLDYNREWLVATVEVKRPSGYSGGLCDGGSKEHVAFWVDWDDTCQWTYAGTVSLKVHDILPFPAGGLHYAAILPVNLSAVRRPCDKTKIARIRAVLSWQTLPSTTDADDLQHWGNRLDAHVQIRPGAPITHPLPHLRSLGGIPIEHIDTTGDGMTKPIGAIPARFWYNDATADHWGLNRDCPFGGSVLAHGMWFPGFKYRIRARQVFNHAINTTLTTSFNITRWTPGFDVQSPDSTNAADPGFGFFTYRDPSLYLENATLGVWPTTDDALWEVQLELATPAYAILGTTPWLRLQLDNTPPDIDLHIDNGGDCKGFDKGDVIQGHFVARDIHFGGFGLSTLPNTVAIPSNQPTTAWPGTVQTPTAPGAAWQLDLGAPISMKPCGYVVHLSVYDRTIRGSQSGPGNHASTDTGFYILPK